MEDFRNKFGWIFCDQTGPVASPMVVKEPESARETHAKRKSTSQNAPDRVLSSNGGRGQCLRSRVPT